MLRHLLSLILATALATPAFAQSAQKDPFSADYTAFLTVPDGLFTENQKASSILGVRAISMDNEHIGDVGDIIMDAEDPSVVRGYIVDTGGILGIDETRVFVPLDRAKVRIDSLNVELLVDIGASEFRADAKID